MQYSPNNNSKRERIVDNSMNGQVALLIDFEKLATAEDIDCEVLINFAKEYGRVLIANAYADWKDISYDSYQSDLRRFSIDLIQVTADDKKKNAVDLKLAVDAIDLIRAMPQINVFVIVSGDRDFIHFYKVLRSNGKTIIGISRQVHYQHNLARFCDCFVQYEYLTGAQSLDQTPVQKITKEPASCSKNSIRADTLLPEVNKELGDFFQNTYKRRKILQAIFAAINSNVVCNFESAYAHIAKDIPDRAVVYSHLMGVYHGNFFEKPAFRSGLPLEKQQLTIKERINTEYYFIRAYETYVASTLRKLVGDEQELSVSLLAEILGLPEDEGNLNLKYCKLLFPHIATLLRRLDESLDGFCQDADERRNTLKIIYKAIMQKQPFRFDDISAHIEKINMENKPLYSVVQSYLKSADNGRFFEWTTSRKLSLRKNINTEDAFIRAYEQYVVFLLSKFVNNEQELSASLLAGILGLQKDEEGLAYCQSLLDTLLLLKLDKYFDGFCQDVDERHNTLKIIYMAIMQKQPFRFDEIYARIEKMDIENKPLHSVVQSYLMSAFFGQCFDGQNFQDKVPAEKRQFSLRKDNIYTKVAAIRTKGAFIRAYEQSIAFKLRKLVDNEQELSASLLAGILGLPKDEKELAYCQSLLDALD